MDAIQVPLDEIVLDLRLQMRAAIDTNTIDEYAEAVLELPPGKIVKDASSEVMWLYDGWHTHGAHKKAGLDKMPCLIREGTFFDALILAAGANYSHGMKRTQADKRRAILAILTQLPSKSEREVARICHVSNHLVAMVKKENSHSDEISNVGSQSGQPVTSSGSSPTPENALIRCPACARKARVGQDAPKRCKDCDEARKAAVQPKALPSQTDTPSLEETDRPPPPPPAHDGRVLDDAGIVVPEWLVGVFNLRGLIKDAALALSKSTTPLAEVENSPSWQKCKPSGEVWAKYSKAIKAAAKALRDNRPAIVCPTCNGDAGPCCDDKGFIIAAKAKGRA